MSFIKSCWREIIIGICLVWIAFPHIFTPKHSHTQTIYKTDTVTITRTDTFTKVSPMFITKTLLDTFYVYVNDTIRVPIPIEQKYYKEEGKYEAWVSGYKPSLDKINVFNKTEYKTVTNNIYRNAWRGYISGQIQTFSGQVIPSINLTITSPENVLMGAGIGIYNNKPVYNLSVGYKIFEK